MSPRALRAPLTVVAAALLALVTTTPRRSRAEASELSRAEELVAAGDFRAAHALLRRLIDGGGLATEELTRAYQGLARSAAAERRPEEALESFRWLLALDEGFELPELSSPLLTEPFQEAQDFWRDRGRPRISCRAPSQVDRDEPLLLDPRVEADDFPAFAASVILRVRSPEGQFEPIEPRSDGRFVIEPALFEGAEEVAFYLAALDERGNVTMTLGTEADPLRSRVGRGTRARGGSIVRRWWFWTAVGIVATTLVLSLALPFGLDHDEPDPCQQVLGSSCEYHLVLDLGP